MSDYSDSESSQNEAQKIQELEKKVDLLTKENQTLKSQFDSAIGLTKQLQNSRSRIEEQQKELRELQRKNEDLSHRIEILNQTLEENSQKAASEKEIVVKQKDSDLEMKDKEIDQLKNEMAEKIANLTESLQQKDSEKKEQETFIKTNDAKQAKLVKVASNYHQTEFQNIEDLIQFLSDPQKSQQKSASQIPSTPRSASKFDDNNAEKLKKKLKSSQKREKQAHEIIEEYQETLDQMNAKLRESEAQRAAEVDKLQEELKQNQEHNKLLLDDKEHQISVLQKKLTNTRLQLNQTKSKLDSTTIAIPTDINASIISSTPNPNNKPLQEQTNVNTLDFTYPPRERTISEAAFDQMTVRNDALNRQIHEMEQNNDQVQEELTHATQEIEKLKTEIEKQKHSYNSLNLVHNETVSELDTLRKTLLTLGAEREKKEKRDLAQKDKEIQKLKQKIQALDKQLQQTKNSLQETSLEAANQKQENNQLELTNKRLENEVDKYNERIKQLNSEIAEMEIKSQMNHEVKEEDLVPQSSWRCSLFDNDLQQSVFNIANHEAMQLQSKISNALKAVAQYYEDLLDNSNTETDIAYQKLKELSSQIDKYIVDVSITITGEPSSIDQFQKDQGKESLDQITTMKQEYDDMKRKYTNLTSFKDAFIEAFQIDLPKMNELEEQQVLLSELDAIREQFESQSQDLNKGKKRVKELKSALDYLQNKAKSEIRSLEEENSSLTNSLKNLQEKNDSLKEENNNLKKENHNLTKQLREVNDDARSDTSFEREQAREEEDSTILQLQQKYNQQLAEYETKQKELLQQLHQAESELNQLRSVIMQQKKNMDSKTEELNTEREANSKYIDESQQRFAEEKDHIVKQYEDAISQIKATNEERRKDIEKLTGDVQKLENEKTELTKKYKQARRNNKSLQETMRIAKEQYERDSQIAESKHAAELLDLDSQNLNKLNQQEQAFDKEKIALYSYVTSEFNQFYKSSTTLSERTFKDVISQAKKELERLTKSDNAIRKMTKAKDKQTTEDAVAQLLL